MSGVGIFQSSLSGGELSPSLWAAVSLARYQNSLALGRNFIIKPYGGAWNRSGTTMVAEVKDSAKRVRLVPFQFSTDQAYVLEMGEGYTRMFSGGAPVLSGGVPVEVATPFTEAELRDVAYTQSADVMTMAHQAHAPVNLNRTAAASWSLSSYEFEGGPLQTLNTDKAKNVYVSGSVGTITISANAPIFDAGKVGQFFYMEQRNVGQAWESGKTVAAGDVRMSRGKYYRALQGGTTGSLIPDHDEDVQSDGRINWLYLHDGSGMATITAVAVDGKSATAEAEGYIPDDLVLPDGVSVTTNITALGTQVMSHLVSVVKATCAGHGFTDQFYGDVVINWKDTDGDDQQFKSTVLVTVVDANNLLIHQDTRAFTHWASWVPAGSSITVAQSYKWAFGAWGGDQGWPAAVTYHQQRLVFASTPAQPMQVWMSYIGGFTTWGESTPSRDDDPIEVTLAARQINAVRQLLSLDRLVAFTSGAVFAIGSGSEDVLTPSNRSAALQGYRGAAALTPIGVGNTALWLQDKGRVLRDLSFDLNSNSFTGNDLSAMASHLTERSRIVEWAWHDAPHQCVWAVREDGVLLSITYVREEKVIAWMRHDTYGGFVESVAVVSEGEEDVLYLAVRRTVGGQTKRFIERMATRVVSDVREAHFVDCGLQYDGRNTGSTTITITGGTDWDQTETLTADASAAIFTGASDVGDALVFDAGDRYYRLTISEFVSTTRVKGTLNRILPEAYRGVARTDWAFARGTFAGLDHLEGEQVNILADGFVARQVVSSGKIILDPPAFLVRAGLPIQADIETLSPAPSGGGETLPAKKKTIPSAKLFLHETRGVKVGRDFDHLEEIKPRSTEFYDMPPTPFTGPTDDIVLSSDWSDNGRLAIRQDDPLPVTVLGILPNVVVGG